MVNRPPEARHRAAPSVARHSHSLARRQQKCSLRGRGAVAYRRAHLHTTEWPLGLLTMAIGTNSSARRP